MSQELGFTNINWLRTALVDIFPSLPTFSKSDSSRSSDNSPQQSTSGKSLAMEQSTFDLKPFREHHTITSSTFAMTEPFRQDMMRQLFNLMKISEMRRYSIDVLFRGLAKYFCYLSESDCEALVTSYWCNGEHFSAMILCRGVRLYNNEELRMRMSDDLLDRAMSGGASISKLKLMLSQKRADILRQYWREDPTKVMNRILESERKFFVRNCCLRFWNHEVLICTFSQLGWLTEELAQIGLSKFCTYISDRLQNCSQKDCRFRESEPCSSTTHSRVRSPLRNNLRKRNCRHSGNSNEPREQSRRSRRIVDAQPSRQQRVERLLSSCDQVDPDFARDEIASGSTVLRSPSEESQKTVHKAPRVTAPLSLKNLQKWLHLLELTTSRGGRVSEVDTRLPFSAVCDTHRLHITLKGQNTTCWDCSCLMGAIRRGENTYLFVKLTLEEQNGLISGHNLEMPRELWQIVTEYL